jgi:hypothetical protein
VTHSAEHGELRARLVQRLAGQGEPLFVAGERALPAAALFAARRVHIAQPTDRLDALVNVVASLWERGSATAEEIAGLAPHAVGGAGAAWLAGVSAAAVDHEAEEFDADPWLATTRCPGDEIVHRLLFGARLVSLAPTSIRAPHPCGPRAIF